ncbi:MAG: aminopeptidase P family protein [Alphaproteobacteria bacterium]|nr:aminopeptidase P family protein [Alphaproteobacteria bacterium]
MTPDDATREPFQGDAALDRLLAKAGLSVDAAWVRELIRGVLAAPAPMAEADRWIGLVAADPSPDLAAQLRALKREMAAAGTKAPPAAGQRVQRLADLRAELERRGLEGFIVPRADEHQGEYVAKRAERLPWLTGFAGSAGVAVVLQDRAAIFVDGRYTLQVRDQVDTALFEPRHITDQPPADWLAANLKPGRKVGYDPWLLPPASVERLAAACAKAGGEMVALDDNPVDAVWRDQPPPPIAPVMPQDLRYAGRSAADKRQDIARKLAADDVDAAVLTDPASLAWLFNIRGGDVSHTPLPLGFAIVGKDGAARLYLDARKLLAETRAHLGNSVAVESPAAFPAGLDALKDKRVLVDPTTAGAAVLDRLAKAGAKPVRGEDPCALPRACKNKVELDGARAAHRRDGVALVRFMAWLARATSAGTVDELGASDRLEAFRRDGELFRDLSFDTISGAGPNGAIVHYKSSAATNRKLEPGNLYLLDSGAQYLDGTTDVTRTVAIGTPTAEMRDRFTRVLKGHIAIATARFPHGTSGSQLDPLARHALWQAGLDFDHGTGHGVGSYLSVHEGPHRISKVPNTVALKPGMIVSNEPGYYKTGAFGIRIENLVTVIDVPKPPGGERALLGFETLTLCPIDRTLVDTALLTRDEIAWLDAYHATVGAAIGPLVDGETRAWLEAVTRPVVG